MRKFKGFQFDTFEITPREIIASVVIVGVMFLIGFTISGKIDNYIMDQNEEYNRAAKIESNDLFQYGMETDLGNAFVYGKIEPVDTVTYKEIGGKYYYIRKIREEYRRHEKTERVKDSKGKVHYKKKVWYSWDDVWRKSKTCKKIKFAGKKFKQDKVDFIGSHYLKRIYHTSRVRYEYYGMEAKPVKGTVYTKLKNNTMASCDLNKSNLKDTVESYKTSGGVLKILFWVFWITGTGLAVFGFYYLDNHWLE